MKKTIVSKVAYLIGVKEETLYQQFDPDIVEDICNNMSAEIIRTCCQIRTFLMKHFNDLSFNIESQSEFISLFLTLKRLGITLDINLKNSKDFFEFASQLIVEHIKDIRELFVDEYINFSEIRQFISHEAAFDDSFFDDEATFFRKHISHYPFGNYVNFHNNRSGNILFSDSVFVKIITKQNVNNVCLSTQLSFQSISDFLKNSHFPVMVVDCENTDAFKFFNLLEKLNDEEEKKQLKCIYLVTDAHASVAWKYLPDYFNDLKFEIIESERIHPDKSLVDENIMLMISKMHFLSGMDSFIIVSSDSDFWALNNLSPNIKLFFVLDNSRASKHTFEVLNRDSIGYEILNNGYSEAMDQFKMNVIKNVFNDIFKQEIDVNLFTIFWKTLNRVKLQMKKEEMKITMDSFMEFSKIEISEDGKLIFSF